MNKKYLIIAAVIIIVIALAIWWVFMKNDFRQVVPQYQQTSDTIDSINQDLNSVDLGNLDEEFKDIDKDINSL